MPAQTLIYITFALAAAGLGISVYAIMALARHTKLQQQFLFSGQPKALEKILGGLAQNQTNLQKDQDKIIAQLQNLQHGLDFAIQKTGVVRFNSFSDQGGNLSFVVALLDNRDNGLLITNLHGREQNRIYTKVLEQGSSQIPLTQEEKSALSLAEQNFQEKSTYKNQKPKIL